uniref:Uncharacterized protein n=1 Tax=Daphnia galeata TaxID=27404 RepID=A0A8J2WEP3_9CRUS|nr:unnamed protein product [Daphnia galeata]
MAATKVNLDKVCTLNAAFFGEILITSNVGYVENRDWSAVKRNPMRIARSIDDFPARLRSSFTRHKKRKKNVREIREEEEEIIYPKRCTALEEKKECGDRFN